MKIRNKEEYEEFKRSTLPKEMVEHPAFREACDWTVGGFFSNGYSIDVELSADNKSLFVKTNAKVFRGTDDPHSVMQGIDITLDNNGGLSKTMTYGELYDAVPYYHRYSQAGNSSLNISQIDSVLSTSYTHIIYDKNGIVMASSNYYKSDWGLNCQRFDDENKFRSQLFSNGWHKPSEWSYDGRPKIPHYCKGAYVAGTIRDPEHPGLANLYSQEVGNNGMITKTKSSLGYVHGEWPDILRVDHYEVYAELKDGNWEVTDEFKSYHPNMSVEEIRKMLALRFDDALEGSETKKYRSGKYIALKELTAEANAKYTAGRSM